MHFDIILPSIGRDSLQAAIDSVINQSYDDWLLWIIGDHCKCPTWHETIDDRIITYEIGGLPNELDYGAKARNFGIQQGERPWIAYIDDDDEWHPHHLATHARMSEENPSVTMTRTAGRSFMMKHKHPRSSKLVRKMGTLNTTDILTVGMAHSRELFEHTSGWQPHDNHDRTLWNEMLTAGGEACESDTVTYNFRR